MAFFVMQRISLFIVTASLSLGSLISSANAQDGKTPFDPSKAQLQPIGLPSPIDKFLGLDMALGQKTVSWKQVYNDISQDVDATAIKGEANICLALGVKIADGVMAIKSQNASALNDCATQIEDLAGKLGITKDQLGRAEKVRADANKGRWLLVFMELGFLQTDIMKALQQGGNAKRRTLIIASGWLQGAHYAADVIASHYTPELSNFLREPQLVQALIDEVKALPPELQNAERVQKLAVGLSELHGIVNIPLDGSIDKEKVERMNKLAAELVKLFVS